MRLINLGLKIRQTALQQLPDFCGPVPKGREGAIYCGVSRHNNPRPRSGCQTSEPSGQRPVNPKNLFSESSRRLVFTVFPSLTILTEILRFAQNDCRAGRLARNAVFILIDAKGADTTTLSGKGRC